LFAVCIVCGVKRGEMGCVVDTERADAIALDCEFVDATGVTRQNAALAVVVGA